MAKNDARKSFVAARLKETGKEATPEQRAKFRERFNQLAQTKEGRTKIAQKVLPSGTAAERATLKKSIRPTQTGTGTTSTGDTKDDTKKVITYPGMGGNPTTIIPGTKTSVTGTTPTTLPRTTTTTTVPRTTTTTTVPRTTTTTTTVPRFKALESFGIQPGTKNETSKGSAKNDLTKALNWLGKGMPGTDEWFAKDRIVGFSAADLPLGAGQIYTGIKETKKGNYVGGIARTLAGVGELAINILSTKGGASYKPLKPNIEYPKTGLEMPKLPRYVGGDVALSGRAGANQRVAARAQNTDLYKQLIAAGKLKVPSSKIPAPVFGSVADQRAAAAGKDAFIGPILPRPVFGSVKDQRAAAGTSPTIPPSYVNPLKLTSVPVNPPRSKPGKPRVTKPKTEKPVEVKSGTPSPPTTTPMKYDAEGYRLNQVGERVTDPTSDAGLKGWRPGDAKPKAPPVGRTKGKTTTEWLDYEYRLDAYNKYNPKKK